MSFLIISVILIVIGYQWVKAHQKNSLTDKIHQNNVEWYEFLSGFWESTKKPSEKHLLSKILNTI